MLGVPVRPATALLASAFGLAAAGLQLTVAKHWSGTSADVLFAAISTFAAPAAATSLLSFVGAPPSMDFEPGAALRALRGPWPAWRPPRCLGFASSPLPAATASDRPRK